MRRRPGAAVAVAALALAAIASLRATGGTGPVLYDGLCVPASYAKLGANPGPTSASRPITTGSDFPTSEVATGESTPQAQVILAEGSFSVAPNSTVTVTIKPVPPPSVTPADGGIDGNVYDIEATGPGGETLSLAAGHPATIVLLATARGGPTITLEHFDGTRWGALKTFQSGCGDTDEAASPALGTFALVVQGGGSGSATPSQPSAPGSGTAILVVIGAVLGMIVLVIGTARFSRRGRSNPGRRRR